MRAAALALLILLTGCAARRLRQAPAEAGVARSYLGSFESVQWAALAALADLEFAVYEERWIERGRWCVVGSAPGRAARIVVEDHPVECRVWVIEQPDELHERIGRILGQERRPEPATGEVAAEKEERCASPLALCFERIAAACRERGYRILRADASDPALRTLAAEKPSARLFAALYRLDEERTRVVVDVRGGTREENEAEAAALLAPFR